MVNDDIQPDDALRLARADASPIDIELVDNFKAMSALDQNELLFLLMLRMLGWMSHHGIIPNADQPKPN